MDRAASGRPDSTHEQERGNDGGNENGERQPLDVKVGDRVLFAKYAGTEIKQNGSRQLIMRESDLLAVVE